MRKFLMFGIIVLVACTAFVLAGCSGGGNPCADSCNRHSGDVASCHCHGNCGTSGCECHSGH